MREGGREGGREAGGEEGYLEFNRTPVPLPYSTRQRLVAPCRAFGPGGNVCSSRVQGDVRRSRDRDQG